MATSSSTVSLNLSLSLHNTPHAAFPSSLISIKPLLSRYSHLKFPLFASSSSSSSSSSPSHPDNILWLREEQRWLREEQRWLREEARWCSDRESLLRQISDLKLKLLALERHNLLQVSDSFCVFLSFDCDYLIHCFIRFLTVRSLKVIDDVDSVSNVGRIAEIGSSVTPLMLATKEEEVAVVKSDEVDVKIFRRKTLKRGSEGDEVRVLQEALQQLGFYSGEEDVEFSSFSTGTERAVKTWQASLGISEDGIMTADLIETLYTGQPFPTKEGANGAVVSSVNFFTETQQTVVKEKDVKKYDASQDRVFLLGENRWEDPSRLIGSKSKAGQSKISKASSKCLVCRGEGRILCMECDGTGEPNIEPQFVEWVDEGTKCPYCEGIGYAICDLCEGKTVA